MSEQFKCQPTEDNWTNRAERTQILNPRQFIRDRSSKLIGLQFKCSEPREVGQTCRYCASKVIPIQIQCDLIRDNGRGKNDKGEKTCKWWDGKEDNVKNGLT